MHWGNCLMPRLAGGRNERFGVHSADSRRFMRHVCPQFQIEFRLAVSAERARARSS